MGGRLCYAVYPGDAATALIPFDASVKLATPSGRRNSPSSNWCPGDMMVDGRIQSHVVRFNEILTEVRHPGAEAGLASVVREAAAARRVGFRHGLAGHERFNCTTTDRGRARRVRRDIAGKPLARNGRRRISERKDAERGLGRSGGRRSPDECRAAEIQRHQKIDMAKGLLASGLWSELQCGPIKASSSNPFVSPTPKDPTKMSSPLLPN